MKIYSLRGRGSQYPENTMPAFESALKYGAEGLLLDVHLSRDHQVVIFQDDTLGRLVDGVGLIRHHSLEEIQSYNFIDSPSNSIHIPSLEEYLTWAKDLPHRSIIFLRNDLFYYPNLEEELAALLSKYEITDRVTILTKRRQSLKLIHSHFPEIETAWLADNTNEESFDFLKESETGKIVIDFPAAGHRLTALAREGVEELAIMGVDQENQIDRLKDLSPDMVITGDVKLLREALEIFKMPFSKEELSALYEQKEESAKDEKDNQFKTLARKARELTDSKSKKSRGNIFAIIMSMLVCVVVASALTAILMNLLKGIFK